MLKKGDIIKIEIEKIVFGGEGLAYHDGIVIFVPKSVPGDIVEVEIISLKKSYGRGIITNIIENSKNRIKPECDCFLECGACDFMMIDYKIQLKYKKDMLDDVLKNIGKLLNVVTDDCEPSEDMLRYRNKIIQAFGKKGEKIVSGFYKKRSHEIVENDNCIIQSVQSNKILKKMKEKLLKNSISIYNETNKKGILRNVMIRKNLNEEYMLVAVSNSKKIKNLKQLILELCNSEDCIKSAYISINTSGSNFVLGTDNIHIYGEKYLFEDIEGLRFAISPLSFFQINTKQAKRLYNKAINYLDNIEDKVIIDAYAGTGTIGMILSKRARQVYSIEITKSACEDAISALKLNKIDNVKVINGKVEEILLELIDDGVKVDAIVFDPPRKGLDKDIIDKVNEAGIKEIVYISCNGASFARDINLFSKYKYKVEKLCPVDMFPNTSHIEIVSKLVKEV